MELKNKNISTITLEELYNDALHSNELERINYLIELSESKVRFNTKKQGQVMRPMPLMTIRSKYLQKFHNYQPGAKVSAVDKRTAKLVAIREAMLRKEVA